MNGVSETNDKYHGLFRTRAYYLKLISSRTVGGHIRGTAGK